MAKIQNTPNSAQLTDVHTLNFQVLAAFKSQGFLTNYFAEVTLINRKEKFIREMITQTERDAFARRYRIQYESFGKDRKQEQVPSTEEMPK